MKDYCVDQIDNVVDGRNADMYDGNIYDDRSNIIAENPTEEQKNFYLVNNSKDIIQKQIWDNNNNNNDKISHTNGNHKADARREKKKLRKHPQLLSQSLEIQFPIQVKQLTDEARRQFLDEVEEKGLVKKAEPKKSTVEIKSIECGFNPYALTSKENGVSSNLYRRTNYNDNKLLAFKK